MGSEDVRRLGATLAVVLAVAACGDDDPALDAPTTTVSTTATAVPSTSATTSTSTTAPSTTPAPADQIQLTAVDPAAATVTGLLGDTETTLPVAPGAELTVLDADGPLTVDLIGLAAFVDRRLGELGGTLPGVPFAVDQSGGAVVRLTEIAPG